LLSGAEREFPTLARVFERVVRIERLDGRTPLGPRSGALPSPRRGLGAAWDHRTGDGVAAGRLGWCFLRFPAGQGVFRGDSIYASGSPGLQFPVRDGVKGGEPFRALVQLFPDGRCGYAVGGFPLHVTRPQFSATRGRIVIRGRSVDAEVVVGRLRVFSGVAPDIDWRVRETGASAVR
jgi:hypothetical protein